MKATTWLCPVLTLLCATKLVCTAQRGVTYASYPAMDGLDSSLLQNDYILSKRNKPSLSIVNPLDVLRQRLLLEIARRQMKENTRQVELNRAILKNVGKRMLNKHPYRLESTATRWDPLNLYNSQNHQQTQQQQHQLSTMQRESAMHLQPYDLELIPSTLIFDYLQQRRPWLPYERTAAPAFDNYDMEFNDNVDAGEGGDVEAESGDDVVMGLGLGDSSNDIKLSLEPMNGHKTEYDGQHKTTVKKPITRSGLESGGGGAIDGKSNVLAPLKQHKTFNNDYKLNDLTTLELNEAASAMGKGNSDNQSDNIKNMDNDDYQVQRYLYHLHKNHLTRK